MRGEFGAAIGRLADQPGDRHQIGPVGNFLRQDFDGAGDDGQHIVEVMRDAAGQLADGLHLLGLPQLLVGRDLLRHIPDEGVDHIAAAAAKRLQRHFDLDRMSVLADGVGLKAFAGGRVLLVAQQLLPHLLSVRLHLFRQQQADQLLAQHLLP